jgi:hypothetical protein
MHILKKYVVVKTLYKEGRKTERAEKEKSSDGRIPPIKLKEQREI